MTTSNHELLEEICRIYEAQNPSIALALTCFSERYESNLKKELRLMKQKCYAYRDKAMPIREIISLIDEFSDHLYSR